jgi:hypothetical protein
MKLKRLTFLILLIGLVMIFPHPITLSSEELITQSQPAISKAYQEALVDAADPQPYEVIENLTAIINPDTNPDLNWDNQGRVLVATFTRKNKFETGDLIASRPDKVTVIWVTVVPELKDFCTNYKDTGVNNQQLNLRLKQLLGLPSEEDYVEIAEIRVHPKYLKRPTLDPEIDDSTVQLIPNPVQYPLSFEENVAQSYQDWLINLVKKRNESRYPWTGLGYTYDWGIYPKTGLQSDAGLSEFVIFLKPNAELSSSIEVQQVLSTGEYCH